MDKEIDSKSEKGNNRQSYCFDGLKFVNRRKRSGILNIKAVNPQSLG